MINYDIPLNFRGNNDNITASLSIDDDTMISNGFSLYNGRWNYIEELGYNVTLNIYILCDTVIIDVIDEQFLQPFDYQWMLRNNPESEAALVVHSKVQATMKRLSDAGIIEGWVANDYI